MNNIRGNLLYSPEEPSPIKISATSGIYDLWPLLEPTFWALSGLYVKHKVNELVSYTLELDTKRDWVLHYESREKIFLWKPGKPDRFSVADHLHSMLLFLNTREVNIEADSEHFKIYTS